MESDSSKPQVEARRKAMDLLARREHSKAELQSKLVAKGFERDLAKQAIETLTKEGLQSDARFVEAYTNSRANRGYGPTRIAAELRERKADETLIEEAINENAPHWLKKAEEVKNKKFGNKKPETYEEHTKQMRFLQYRGFTTTQINQTCKERL